MTALPAVAATLRVDLIHSTGADLSAGSRLFYKYTGTAPDPAECITLAGSISGLWGTYLKGFYNSSFGLQRVVVTDLASGSGAQGQSPTPVSGTDTGTPLPPATAVLFNAHILRRYRGGKPRVYVPFGTADALGTSGQWVGTFRTNLEAAWTNFVTHITGLSATGPTISDNVNVSYFSGKTMRATPVTDVIQSWTLNAIPGSQRRRNLR